jgi:hypothetical protein
LYFHRDSTLKFWFKGRQGVAGKVTAAVPEVGVRDAVAGEVAGIVAVALGTDVAGIGVEVGVTGVGVKVAEGVNVSEGVSVMVGAMVGVNVIGLMPVVAAPESGKTLTSCRKEFMPSFPGTLPLVPLLAS